MSTATFQGNLIAKFYLCRSGDRPYVLPPKKVWLTADFLIGPYKYQWSSADQMHCSRHSLSHLRLVGRCSDTDVRQLS
jgi:hypothetical protein